jgi:hypothetical protein
MFQNSKYNYPMLSTLGYTDLPLLANFKGVLYEHSSHSMKIPHPIISDSSLYYFLIFLFKYAEAYYN